MFITNGWLCDLCIVCAKTDTGKGAHGVSLFLIEDGMKGFIKGQKLNKMGLKAQDTSELFFEDLRVPASALLGEENKVGGSRSTGNAPRPQKDLWVARCETQRLCIY